MFCIMILMVVIAGCSKEKENNISAKAKDSYTVKHAMGETTVNGTPKKLLF